MISHIPICQFQSRQTHRYLEAGWQPLMSKYHTSAFSVETDMHQLVCNIHEHPAKGYILLTLPLWRGRLCHAGWIATLPPPKKKQKTKRTVKAFPSFTPKEEEEGGNVILIKCEILLQVMRCALSSSMIPNIGLRCLLLKSARYYYICCQNTEYNYSIFFITIIY